ncbi:hypothetical protein [Brevundimonas sp.]|jgi:hypothetical protein|uniref:hypothetical protein n=1 Tax=Brevundimonas sp. TaxID=1871086 RepID=UPI0037BF30B0
MKPFVTFGLGCALAVSACASTPDAPPPPPNYAAMPTQDPTRNARLYAACFEQAAISGAYRRAADGGGEELLLFTCTGVPAQAFVAALTPWSETIGSSFERDGRTFRSTARVRANLFGVDYCSTDAAGGDPVCVLSFNAGDFLDQ